MIIYLRPTPNICPCDRHGRGASTMSEAEKVSSNTGTNGGIDFDPDALRAKYRAERDRRVRADHNDQYVEIAGDFSRFERDPYADPITREPLHGDIGVLIIGGGFGGLLAAARLRE